jgi:hypothetical protein
MFSMNSLDETAEKVLLIEIIGILEALESNAISLNEAENICFSPYIQKKLKEKKCNPEILEIVERGCELEDIKSLIPESYYKNIADLKNLGLALVGKYPFIHSSFWRE